MTLTGKESEFRNNIKHYETATDDEKERERESESEEKGREICQ